MTTKLEELKAKWAKLRAMRPLVGTLSPAEMDNLFVEIDRLGRENDRLRAVGRAAAEVAHMTALRMAQLEQQAPDSPDAVGDPMLLVSRTKAAAESLEARIERDLGPPTFETLRGDDLTLVGREMYGVERELDDEFRARCKAKVHAPPGGEPVAWAGKDGGAMTRYDDTTKIDRTVDEVRAAWREFLLTRKVADETRHPGPLFYAYNERGGAVLASSGIEEVVARFVPDAKGYAKVFARAPEDVAYLLAEIDRLNKVLARRRISGVWPEAEDRSGLAVWYDGGEKVVAASAEDALAVWAEFSGRKPEEHEAWEDGTHFERVPDERNITINMGEDGAGPPVTLPAGTWALLSGRSWLCTENR